MEKDFRYYFQHPYFRLIVAYLVTFCNFLIYAEDPVAHSEAECFIPVVGNTFSFVVTKYPKNAWALLKVIMWLLAILVGLIVGKVFIHKVVFSKFNLFFLKNATVSWNVDILQYKMKYKWDKIARRKRTTSWGCTNINIPSLPWNVFQMCNTCSEPSLTAIWSLKKR